MTMFVFEAKVSRRRRHTVSVFTVDGGWDIRCSCHRWEREGWCDAEGGWRVWMGYVAEDLGAAAATVDPEEYCASPFNFPPGWDPAEHLDGTLIDLMPTYRRQRIEIEVMERRERLERGEP